MSNLIIKSLYSPVNLKVEIKKFLNGYIIWFSSFLYTLRKVGFPTSTLNVQSSNLFFHVKTQHLKFYALQTHILKRKRAKNLSLFYSESIQNSIAVITGYKKILSARGIGYKFNLKNKILFLEVGYSHLLFFSSTRSFKIRFSRKLKGMQAKSENLILLMNFLSTIKRSRPMNVYTRKGIRYNKEALKYKEGKRKKSF